MRLRQTMHRPVLRCRRQALREGMTERDSSHEQHRTKRVRRVFHRQRHSFLRPQQAVRQGVAFHDAGPELPRQGARAPHFPGLGQKYEVALAPIFRRYTIMEAGNSWRQCPNYKGER